MAQQILSYIETGVALVFIFAVLVMFHELGHYLAARLSGIRVEEFAFGFGPKLITLFKRGDTEYTIHPFPVGGFVKLAGMDPGQEDIKDGFQAQSIAKRAFVIFSGPFASLLLGMAVYLCLGLFWGYPGPERTNKVAMVSPQTEAARIGLKAGDRITEINGVGIDNGEQMLDVISNNPDRRIGIVVERDGEKLNKVGTPKWAITYLGADWHFMKPGKGTVEAIIEGLPAAEAGVQKGDQIVSINGTKIRSGEDMQSAVVAADLEPVKLVLKRGNKTVNVEAKPTIEWVRVGSVKWSFPGGYADFPSRAKVPFQANDRLISVDGKKIDSPKDLMDALRGGEGSDATFVVKRLDKEETISIPVSAEDRANPQSSTYSARGILGFSPENKLEKATVGESLMTGIRVPWLVVQSLAHLNVREDVGGPIMIGKMTHSSVARGPYWVISLLGGLSMSLAFINLLPIPIVDGGHLVILAVEKVRRKRLTVEQMQVVSMVGMVILLGLALLVFSSDLFKILKGLAPQ